MTLEDFKGVDFTSAPTRVAANRAVDSVNLIYENGNDRKRKGWRQIPVPLENGRFSARINGIFEYVSGELRFLLVHAGTRLYLREGDEWRELKASGSLKDGRSLFFMQGSRCVIIGGEVAMIYDPEVERDRVFNLANYPQTYIPTTTANVNADGSKDAAIEVLDKVNLLTKWRKNLLVGNEGSLSTWTLDAPIFLDEEELLDQHDVYITVTAYVQDDTGTIREKITELTNYRYRDTDGYQMTTGYTIEELESRGKVFLRTESSKELKGEMVLCDPITGKGKITLFGIPTTTYDEISNIEVKFKGTDEDRYQRIFQCSFGTLFGPNGNNQYLFLSGNPDSPAQIFYSAYNDFTYFPDTNYIFVGKEHSPVTGFSRLLDDTVAILKNESNQDASIFYLTGELRETYDDAGNLESVTPIFQVRSGGVGEGNLTPYATANLAGDALMLSENGVFGITLSDHIATTARYVKERSYSVNRRLLRHDLTGAVAIVYRNRYYLSVDGVCYVADARHRYSRDGNDVDQSYNYEWWYWDNIPARCFGVIDGMLCFGSEDGRLCVFDGEEYADSICQTLSEGDLSVAPYENGSYVTYNAALDEIVSEGDCLELEDYDGYAYAVAEENISDILDEEGYYSISEEGIARLSEGTSLWAGFVSDSEAGLTVREVTLLEVDRGGCRIRLDGVPSSKDGSFSLYQSLVGKRLLVSNLRVAGEGTFQLKESSDSEPLRLGVMAFTLRRACLTHRTPISARWVTPYFDMGSNLYGKTLLRLTVAAGKESGSFRFGYDTKRTGGVRRMRGIDTLDLNDFSFLSFSTDNDFASAHTVRLNVRNFNYIRFLLESDDAVEFCADRLTALYKINRMNRGVR